MERCLCGIFIVTCVGAVPVTSPGLGSRRAGPGRMLWSPAPPGLCLPGRCACPCCRVPIMAGGLGANCAWWPRAARHPLPFRGTGKALPLPACPQPCSQRMSPSRGVGGWGGVCAEPQLVKLEAPSSGSRSPGAAPWWGHLCGGLWGL